jgi:glycosyltransferase involved in cell wall biosynthesis
MWDEKPDDHFATISHLICSWRLMRVAFLTEKYPPDVGGVAASSARLVNLLVSVGVEVHVFAPFTGRSPAQSEGTGPGLLVMHSLDHMRRVDDTLTAWFEQLAAVHRATPFDIIHTYFITRAGFAGVYAGRTLGVPVVVSARGNDLERAVFDPGKAAHILYALANADAVTTNCQQLARKAEALAAGVQAIVIPNGVDADLFCPAQRDATLAESLGLTERKVVGFVGEGRAKKGLSVLLLAFKQAAERMPLALLLVGGVRAGEDEQTLTVFQKQNPDLYVRVIPYQPAQKLPAYYNLFDLLLLPSLRDGLPNALLEGMACGCAVIGSSVGGMLDVIRPGENGVLVPPGDVAALSEVISDLLTDGARCSRLGENARQMVVAAYTPQRELEANLAIYAGLIPG